VGNQETSSQPTSVIALDSVPYHCLLIATPSSYAVKADMVSWLCKEGVVCDATMNTNVERASVEQLTDTLTIS
jgi:hypothetical protein